MKVELTHVGRRDIPRQSLLRQRRQPLLLRLLQDISLLFPHAAERDKTQERPNLIENFSSFSGEF